MRVACLQMRSGVIPQDNFEVMSAYVRKAAAQGASFIATPEMTGLLQRKPKLFWEAVKSQDQDSLIPAYGALAAELGVTLLIGSHAVKVGDKRAGNRAFVFGPDGALIASYDKIHLFDVDLGRGNSWRESALFDAGARAVTAQVGGATLGLSICYDVRFAHLYTALARSGAQIIAVPAAFTVPTGQAHWEVLLRARAIETGSFILAPAQSGDHDDGRSTYGHSMIINPWGEIIAEREEDGAGLIFADLDLEEVTRARAKIPAWSLDKDYKAP